MSWTALSMWWVCARMHASTHFARCGIMSFSGPSSPPSLFIHAPPSLPLSRCGGINSEDSSPYWYWWWDSYRPPLVASLAAQWSHLCIALPVCPCHRSMPWSGASDRPSSRPVLASRASWPRSRRRYKHVCVLRVGLNRIILSFVLFFFFLSFNCNY